jgi:hypothetical protein
MVGLGQVGVSLDFRLEGVHFVISSALVGLMAFLGELAPMFKMHNILTTDPNEKVTPYFANKENSVPGSIQ